MKFPYLFISAFSLLFLFANCRKNDRDQNPIVRYESRSVDPAKTVNEGDTILLAVVVREGSSALKDFTLTVADTVFASDSMFGEVWAGEYLIPTYSTDSVVLGIMATAEEGLFTEHQFKLNVDTTQFKTKNGTIYPKFNIDSIGWDMVKDTALTDQSGDSVKYIVSNDADSVFTGKLVSKTGLNFCKADSLIDFENILQLDMINTYNDGCSEEINPLQGEVYITKFGSKYCAIKIDTLVLGIGGYIDFTYKKK